MARFAVFLRGVNVGGVKVVMKELVRVLEDSGFSEVSTILASGNVVLDSASSASQVRNSVEAALGQAFDYDAWVVVLSPERLAEIIAANPYPDDSADQHSYVTLVSDPENYAILTAALQDAGEPYSLIPPDAFAWQVAKGSTLDSPISKLTAKPKYKASTTTRNQRTLTKVLAKLG